MALTPGTATAQPDPPGPRGPGALRTRVIRFLLGLLALSLVVSAFTASYLRHREAQEERDPPGGLGSQQAPPGGLLSDAELTRFRAAAANPSEHDAPIVLAYQDVVADPGNPYQVAPREFARQMAMLEAAGYRTLSADEFAAILRGGPSPPRSVLITFDRGGRGLWRHAHPILHRYGFQAVALLITGRLTDRAGRRFLSWSEVRRMAASGVWTFGSNTRDAHRNVPVAASGLRGSELVSPTWTAAGREPMAEFRRRVDADLRGSIRDLTSRGLPRPRLFAYPFSGTSVPGQDGAGPGYVHGRVDALFDAAFSSRSAAPEPVNQRSRSRSPLILDRLTVARHMTASDLFAAMQRMRSLPVADAAPMASGAAWSAPDGGPAPALIDGDRLRFRTSGRYATAFYAPQATGDWIGYRVTATIHGLDAPSVAATLMVRAGGSYGVKVRVSDRLVRVIALSPNGPTVVVTRSAPRGSRVVVIEVRDGRTVVTVDAVRCYDRASVRSPRARGGISAAVLRGHRERPFPVFEQIRVSPLVSG